MSFKNNVPPTGRDFYFSQGVDDDVLSGESNETPVSDPFEGADRAGNADPPPSDNAPVSINGESGTYIGNLTIPEFGNFNGKNVAIVAFSGVTVDCLGRQRVELGASINTGTNGVCVNLDGVNRVGVNSTTIVIGGDDGIGFDVKGTCDDIFLELLSGTITGERAIMFNHTATSQTPVEYKASVVEFFGVDQTLMEFNPPNSSDQAFVTIVTAQDGNGAVNSTVFHVMNGRLDIDAKVLQGQDLLIVDNAAQATLDLSIGIGNITARSASQITAKSIGVLVGDILIEADSHVDMFAAEIIGNITIDAGGILDCNILSHAGTIVNNGTINGFINGDRYGKGNSESTTLTGGGVITEGTLNTQIDISEGSGTIYDYTDPANVAVFPVTWSAFTDVDLTDLGELFSFIGIDRTGAVAQFGPSDDQFIARRDFIILGTVQHTSGVFEVANANYISARETHAQLMDLLDCLGVINCEGFVIQPNADLTFDKTAGILMNPGAGNVAGSRVENAIDILAESPTVFSRFLGIQEIVTAIGQTLVDPVNYDDGSNVPVLVPGGPNTATIQYIFQFPIDGSVFVQYGQTVYATLDDAVAQASTDNPEIAAFIRQDALLVSRIAMENGATNLSDTNEVRFLPGAKFGVDITGGSGGSGAGGGDVFGPASSNAEEIPVYNDGSGKILDNTSDVTLSAGDFQRITTNDDLRLLVNGTGKVQLGNGNILSNLGMSNTIGGTVVSIATPLAGNAIHQYEHNGVAIGNIGFINFTNNLQFIDISTGKGINIESNGQISLGELETDPNFSVIISGDEKPFGLPNLTTANEGALTPQQRMIHYNPIFDRVRYYDGTAFRSVASLDDIAPLSILKYVDNNTSATNRNGSIGRPYISTTEARAAILDNAIGKQYTLVIIEDDGSSNDPKPFIYQRGVNGEGFTGGARIPNTVGRYEYSNMVVGNINSDNLTAAVESVFTDVHSLASSTIFTVADSTSATAKFVRCQFDGKMDFRHIEAEFIGCEINDIELIDNTLTPKTWIFRSCTFNGTMTTSGASIGCNFTFFNCHWLPSSSLVAGYPMSVTCDNTFPHESDGQVTIVSRLSESVLDDYDNSGSTLSADNVQDAIDEIDGKVGDLESIFAQAVNNAQTTSIGATGVYEHINVDSALSLVSANNWDTFGGRIRFLGVSFAGIIRMTVEVHVPPGSPTPKNYDIRGALNTNVTGIFPTLFDIQAGDYRQISLEFRVSGLNNGDLVDARIRQLSGPVDQNPIISNVTYEAIED